MLDFFFEAYLKEGAPKGLSFVDWVKKDYDRAELKGRFLRTWKSRMNLDQLLQRE